MMKAIDEIRVERARQVTDEGWTPEHDDKHSDGSLAMAAALYASPSPLYATDSAGWSFYDPWPWPDFDKRKRHNDRRRLVIAGALIVAEIERLDRDHA